MSNYIITAIVTKIDSKGQITLNGVGKHRYEKSKDNYMNLLEGDDVKDSKLVELSTPYQVKMDVDLSKIILATAMLQKKPLKLTIEEKEGAFSITAIEVP